MKQQYNILPSGEIDRRGFINQSTILEYVSEEDIFALVFGFKPVEYDYVTSPLRPDRNPGCWFEKSSSLKGKLRFIDFGSNFNRPMDCFDVVQQYFKIPNFYLTLEFIYEKLIKGKNIIAERRIQPSITKKDDAVITFDSRPFVRKDAVYWSRYEISRQNLIEDKVFAVQQFHLLNGKNGDFSTRCYDSCYAYTNFPNGRKKLHFPYREGKNRFISTCNKNDIGGIHKLPFLGNQLIITKSYKDWRVLYNNGKYTVYLQNEGMIPSEEILVPIVSKFKTCLVWFDNDRKGIESSQKLTNIINSYLPSKASALWLPESLNQSGISDPSDLIYRKGKNELINFLKTYTQ